MLNPFNMGRKHMAALEIKDNIYWVGVVDWKWTGTFGIFKVIPWPGKAPPTRRTSSKALFK